MAYNYSNPYQSTSNAASRVQPAPAQLTNPQSRQVLFSGLPVDITERDLRELLTADPLRLPAHAISVECFCGPDARFNGVALVHVASPSDAERVRQAYSGQTVDSTYTVSVSHILPADQSLSSSQSSASSIAARIRPNKPSGDAKSKGPASKGPVSKGGKQERVDDKPAGLKLLARLGKPGQPKDKQVALLEKQKANLAKKSTAGAALLSRLQVSPAGHVAKSKAKPQRLSTGAAKVGRAKAKANNAMDVDKPVSAPRQKKEQPQAKPQPKTQAELDEEMRAYERARRFA